MKLANRFALMSCANTHSAEEDEHVLSSASANVERMGLTLTWQWWPGKQVGAEPGAAATAATVLVCQMHEVTRRLPRPLSLGVQPRKTSYCEVEGSHEHRPRARLSRRATTSFTERARAYWANISAGRLKEYQRRSVRECVNANDVHD